MGTIRFSKRFSISNLVRLNVSKNGFSVNLGPRGCSLSIGTSGVYFNTSIPGTGLSYRQKLNTQKSTKTADSIDTQSLADARLSQEQEDLLFNNYMDMYDKACQIHSELEESNVYTRRDLRRLEDFCQNAFAYFAEMPDFLRKQSTFQRMNAETNDIFALSQSKLSTLYGR